jgi:RNA polymerase sigma factor (sigma-70 family)
MADEIAALIEPHIPALRRYAWALLRDDDAADDLVQDTLERAIARWHLRPRDGNMRAWLFAIEHNLFVSCIRRWSRRGVHVGMDEAAALCAGAPQEASSAMRDVLAAIDALPEEQRTTLLLVGVEDLSYEEAAHVMGVPIGTVMSRLSRGRERLRLLLETGRSPALRRVK